MAARDGSGEERQRLDLAEAAQTLLDECRMVLPGVQALFGFQLIAVFNTRFADELSSGEQELHLLAIALVALSAALIMTPAAVHRHRGPREVTTTFLAVSTRLLLAGMIPLAIALSLDFFLIARLIVGEPPALPLAMGLFAILGFLWLVFPRWGRLHFLLGPRS